MVSMRHKKRRARVSVATVQTIWLRSVSGTQKVTTANDGARWSGAGNQPADSAAAAQDRRDCEPTRPGAETPAEARHPEELTAQYRPDLSTSDL